MKVMKDVDEVINDYTGKSRLVLDYCQIVTDLVNEAKKPGFSNDSWAPLAALVDTEAFERVGNFKEVMTWQQYLDFMTPWAQGSDWECSFKRITESGDTVLLELEERLNMDGYKTSVNSVSVYEFNDAGKIAHIDIYLQMEMPSEEMMKNYEGVA